MIFELTINRCKSNNLQKSRYELDNFRLSEVLIQNRLIFDQQRMLHDTPKEYFLEKIGIRHLLFL